MYHLLDGELAKLPAILDSLFTGITNTTCAPIGVEGKVVGSQEVAGKGYVNTKNSQKASTRWCHFQIYIDITQSS